MLQLLSLLLLLDASISADPRFQFASRLNGNMDISTTNSYLSQPPSTQPQYSRAPQYSSGTQNSQDYFLQDSYDTGYPNTYPDYPGYPNTYPNYPDYPNTYPNYTGYSNTYPDYPGYPNTSPNYPGYPDYPGYPNTSPDYPGYPNTNPGYPNTSPDYPGYPNTYPGYPNTSPNYPSYPDYPGYPSTSPDYPGYPNTYPGYPNTSPDYPGYPNTYPGYPNTSPDYPGYPNTYPGYPNAYSDDSFGIPPPNMIAGIPYDPFTSQISPMSGLGRVLPINQPPYGRPGIQVPQTTRNNGLGRVMSPLNINEEIMMFTLGRALGHLDKLSNKTNTAPFLDYLLGGQQQQYPISSPWGQSSQSAWQQQQQYPIYPWNGPYAQQQQQQYPYSSNGLKSNLMWQPNTPWYFDLLTDQEEQEPNPWWYEVLTKNSGN